MLKILIISLFISHSFAKSEMKELIRSTEQDIFYGETNNVSQQEIVKPLNVAIVNKDECLKFKKNGEVFWNKYETEILKIKEVGDKNLKVVRIVFLSKKVEEWMETDPFILSFEHQLQYEIIECPNDKDKISEQLMKEIQEKIKKK